MRIFKSITISIFLALQFYLHEPALAQTPILIQDEEFVVDARVAIDSLYNRNPEAAKKILQPWISAYPEHPLWPLWDAMELWWFVLNDLADDQYDEEFFNRMKRADYEAGRLLNREPDHPDALIVRAVANGYAARQNANRGNWITSINIGRRAYQAYSRLMEVVPNLPDNYFALGMMRYYSAHVIEKYPVARVGSRFLPDGDKEEGVQFLTNAYYDGVFARPEAAYFLGFILLNYEDEEDEAAKIFRTMSEIYPRNSYYHRLYVRSLMQMRDYELAEVEIQNALQEWDAHGGGVNTILHEELYYWKGRIFFYRGNLSKAEDFFMTAYEIGLYLPNTKDRQFHAVSAYYLARVYERLNNHEKASKYYQISLDQNSSDVVKRLAQTRLDNL